MRKVISSHYARIGRIGGRASTPAKRVAARQNALKRWGRFPAESVLPVETLRDGTWYRGLGRNAAVGLWDARGHCFWTIVLSDFAEPTKFPAQPLRQVRLKQEDYFSESSGSFRPAAAV